MDLPAESYIGAQARERGRGMVFRKFILWLCLLSALTCFLNSLLALMGGVIYLFSPAWEDVINDFSGLVVWPLLCAGLIFVFLAFQIRCLNCGSRLIAIESGRPWRHNWMSALYKTLRKQPLICGECGFENYFNRG